MGLNAKLDNTIDYVNTLNHDFDMNSVTESWINDNDITNLPYLIINHTSNQDWTKKELV